MKVYRVSPAYRLCLGGLLGASGVLLAGLVAVLLALTRPYPILLLVVLLALPFVILPGFIALYRHCYDAAHTVMIGEEA
jgi:hypothetical protein